MADTEEPTSPPRDYAKRLLTILYNDREDHLLRIDDYLHGRQDDPYMPENADDEYQLIAARSITNVMGFITVTPAQAMYVDSFRRGSASDATAAAKTSIATKAVQPEWDHFQKSGLDAKQTPIYTGAFTFGHSFVLTEKTEAKGLRSKGLSALKTSALFEDPANDNDPYVALTVTKMPAKGVPGKARMWDQTTEYEVGFKDFEDFSEGFSVKEIGLHGAEECPVTRFAAAVDLEGRTTGVVEPMMALQDRINQTVFDMLIVQSYASFKVRTISGMAPPMKMKPVYESIDGVQEIVGWEPEIGTDGRPIPANINLNAKRFLFAEDGDTKFDTLDETPLDGFIAAIELAFKHMAALSQTPPHHILGEIANLSAEALQMAETALTRRIEQFKSAFGESWERVFRIAAQIEGLEGASDFSGEVLWRDMGQKSLAQTADALGKFGDQLNIPKRGLWQMVPGITATQLAYWDELRKEEDIEIALANRVTRASAAKDPRTPKPAPPQPATPPAAEAA